MNKPINVNKKLIHKFDKIPFIIKSVYGPTYKFYMNKKSIPVNVKNNKVYVNGFGEEQKKEYLEIFKSNIDTSNSVNWSPIEWENFYKKGSKVYNITIETLEEVSVPSWNMGKKEFNGPVKTGNVFTFVDMKVDAIVDMMVKSEIADFAQDLEHGEEEKRTELLIGKVFVMISEKETRVKEGKEMVWYKHEFKDKTKELSSKFNATITADDLQF